jgi:zinc protease
MLGIAPALCLTGHASAAPEIAFENFQLGNGLQVLLHVDRSAPIVHTEVWYKVGSKDEALNKTGFAHLFEHLMFQGTKHIPEDAFLKYLAKAGNSARNGSTSADRTNYFETLPASQLELALWLESSRMGFLLDRPDWTSTFTNQREVVKNERRETRDNTPMGGLTEVLLEALFPVGHPYRHETIGSMVDLEEASPADLQDFYDRYYAPGNAVLLIAGDIDPSQVKPLVDRYFGPLTPGEPVVRHPVPPLPKRQTEERIAMEAKVNLPHGRMGWPTVPVFTPGDGELDMLAQILGGGNSSRLYQRLVRDLKIAHSVSAYHMSRQLAGIFQISYTPLPGHSLAEIEKIVDLELARLISEPVTQEEIERARNQLKTDTVRSLESLAGLSSRLLYYAVFADDPGYLSRDLARYDEATPERLHEVAQKHLSPKDRVVITVTPDPKAPVMGRRLAIERKKPVLFIREPLDPVKPRISPDASFRKQLPKAAPSRDFRPPKAKQFRLKNGLPVVLVESAKLPLVNVELVIKTGSSANPKGASGLASLVAKMLEEGTTTKSATDIATMASRLGTTLSTHVTWDSSTLGFSVLTENLEATLGLWSDVLLHPAFAPEEFSRVRDSVTASLSRRKDSPATVATEMFNLCLWGADHPFGAPALGTATSLSNLSTEDVRAFYEKYYRPNQAVLVVAGDINEKNLRKMVEPLISRWKAKRIPVLKLPKPIWPEKPHIVLVDKPGAPQSSLRIGLPGIERKHPDYHRALVANNILGGSYKRLMMNLRETKGWTYGVGSLFSMRRAPGPWLVYGEMVAAHTTEAIEEILKEIETLRRDEVPRSELEDVKAEITGAFPARFATASLTAGQFAELAVHDLPQSELQIFTRKIADVTAADVQKTARKYFLPENLLIVVVGDRRSIEARLAKFGTVEVRDSDGNLVTQTP